MLPVVRSSVECPLNSFSPLILRQSTLEGGPAVQMTPLHLVGSDRGYCLKVCASIGYFFQTNVELLQAVSEALSCVFFLSFTEDPIFDAYWTKE